MKLATTLTLLSCLLLVEGALAQGPGDEQPQEAREVSVAQHLRNIRQLLTPRAALPEYVVYRFKRGDGKLKAALAKALFSSGFYCTPAVDVYDAPEVFAGHAADDIIEERTYETTELKIFTRPQGPLWMNVGRVNLWVSSLFKDDPDHHYRYHKY